MRSLLLSLALFLLIGAVQELFSQSLNWRKLQGPYTSYVYDADSLDNFVFVSVDEILYRTSDLGNTWQRAPLASDVRSLASTATAVFAGTGSGILRSLDYGETWTRLDSFPSSTIFLQTMISTGSSVLAGGTNYSGSQNKASALIVRSTNNGESWEDIYPDPAVKGQVSSLVQIGNSIFAFIHTKGIYRSDDDGIHWTKINIGISDSLIAGISAHAGRLYASLIPEYFPERYVYRPVYVSEDLGISWSVMNLPRPGNVLALNSVNGELFISVGNTHWSADEESPGLYHSKDNGQTWIHEELEYPVERSGLVFAHSGHLFVGTNAGIYRLASTATWLPSNTGINLRQQIISSFANTGATLFHSTISGLGPVYRSVDRGETWQRSSFGITTQHGVKTLAASSHSIFAGSNEGVFRSTDNGKNWTELTHFLEESQKGTMALAVSGSTVFMGSHHGGYVSTDNGDTWKSVNLKGGNGIMEAFFHGDRLFATVWGVGVFYSDDLGYSWHPEQNRTIYATNGFAALDTAIFTVSQGLRRSIDRGVSWENLGLHDSLVSLTVQGKRLFAGIQKNGALQGGTVSMSEDYGQSWINTGLTSPTTLYRVYADGNRIFAVTSKALFVADLISSVSEAPAPGGIEVFPNPVSGIAKFSFVLDRTQNVSIRLVNALGEEFFSTNEMREEGEKHFSFDVSGLATGIYYWQVRTAEGSRTGRFAVSR